VNVGKETLSIVCGGSNLQEGMKVAVALVGAKVRWHGQGDLVEIQLTKLRGVDSFGMICSANEIGIATGKEGEREVLDVSILTAVPGTLLSEALELNDVILDVDNKSLTNRPDLFSHRGMAREIAALLDTTFHDAEPPVLSKGEGYELSVTVADPELCPRYMGVVLDGIRIEPSPDWMQKRLLAVGMHPINNVVDVTNYVMLEMGQSLHAFDAKKLENQSGAKQTIEIRVQRAQDEETFVTLDGEERTLDASMLMICDGKKSVTLAGIMGGKNSEIDENTTAIFLESANFHPSCIRTTSQKLGLRSEASLRYEKSLDPHLSDVALCRTVELLCQIIPGAHVVSPVADVSHFSLHQGPILFSMEKLISKIGIGISSKETEGILQRLGFALKKEGEDFLVTIPTWRATKDISIFEDLVEEVVRVYGYDRIPCLLPMGKMEPPKQDLSRLLQRQVRSILSQHFFATETYNYSFVSPAILSAMKENVSLYIELENPLSKERPYLVRSLVPNLLENVKKNQHGFDPVCLFEIGRTYLQEEQGEENGETNTFLPRQDHVLGLVFAGKSGDSLHQVKRICAGLLETLGYSYMFSPFQEKMFWMQKGISACISVCGEDVGYFTEVKSDVLAELGVDVSTTVMELNLTKMTQLPKQKKVYEFIPLFPEGKRDLAFVIGEQVAYGEMEKVLRAQTPLLRGIELFDVYTGKGIPEGKKSIALHFVFRADDHTLSSEEVDGIMENIRRVLEEQFFAIVRG